MAHTMVCPSQSLKLLKGIAFDPSLKNAHFLEKNQFMCEKGIE
jgi:hypothetical protein